METEKSKARRIGTFAIYFVLIGAAILLAAHFMKPSPVDQASNENMTLFIDNKISDIDRKLENGEDETDLATKISWHKSNSALYNEAKKSPDAAVHKQSDQLKDKILKVQKKEFPALRNAYVDSKKDVLQQEHIDIAASGENSEVLTLTGEMFEPKKAQKDFMKSIHDIVYDLRFKKIVYKWSSGKTDIADYEIDSKSDAEI